MFGPDLKIRKSKIPENCFTKTPEMIELEISIKGEPNSESKTKSMSSPTRNRVNDEVDPAKNHINRS